MVTLINQGVVLSAANNITTGRIYQSVKFFCNRRCSIAGRRINEDDGLPGIKIT